MEEQERTKEQDKAAIWFFALMGVIVIIIATSGSWDEFIRAIIGLSVIMAIIAGLAKVNGGL